MARFRLSRLPQEARIYLVILLLIAVPSLVLAWLASRVVGQEVGALNQKTQEIYVHAVNQVVLKAMTTMDEVRATVDSLCAREDILNGQLEHVMQQVQAESDRLPILDLYFVYNESGRRIMPARGRSFVSLQMPQEPFTPLPWNSALRQALAYEYEEKDYAKAIAAYDEAQRTAGEDGAIVVAGLTGEIRCHLRLGDTKTAMDRCFALARHSLISDSSGLPAELIARALIGDILAREGNEIAFVNQRLQFLRWLYDPEFVAALDPAQLIYYQLRARRELEKVFDAKPQELSLEREAYREILKEGQRVLQQQAADEQVVAWLTEQVEPRVLGDMARGPLGPPAPVFVEGALGLGEPAVICYGLSRRPQDGTVRWAIGFLLSSELLRSQLDPSRVTEFGFLEQSNLRIQIRDSAGNALLGELPTPSRVVLARALPVRYPRWEVQLVAVGDVPVPAVVKVRTALLVGLLVVTAVTLGAGIFVTLWTSAREIRTARMRSDFVSAVTHELKTPLTSIGMFAEMLRTGRYRTEEERRRYVEAISDEGQRLSRLIERVLDFARIERGTRHYSFQQVEPAELIDGALDSIQAQFDREGCSVETEVEPDLPALRADPDAITEILLNLLGNALKYTPGEKHIRLRVRRRGDSVCISVIDNGIGIGRKDLKRIFEKFYRAQTPAVQETDGTGLGLTVSRSIAQAHGGDIEVESEPGKGSTFTLVLPAA